MKNIFLGLIGLLVLSSFNNDSKIENKSEDCEHDKDAMVVVMRFEIKVKPESVSFLKHSFDACKAEVLVKEPGCMDYSLFQSYNDSTRFCITETWATKADHNAHMKLDHTKKHIAETRSIHDPSLRNLIPIMFIGFAHAPTKSSKYFRQGSATCQIARINLKIIIPL